MNDISLLSAAINNDESMLPSIVIDKFQVPLI